MKMLVKDFNKVLEIDPAFQDTYYQLGLSCFELGNFEDALRAFEAVLETNPG